MKMTYAWKQSGLFDVTMTAYYGAEVCKLVCTYMLFYVIYIAIRKKKFSKKDFGLYHDDGLGLVKYKSGQETEEVKKNLYTNSI